MRSFCTCLAGAFLVAGLMLLAPGCDSGTSGLEKPPTEVKNLTPENDMPGFKEQREKLKKEGKIK